MGAFSDIPIEIIPLIIEKVDQRYLYNCALVNHLFYQTTIPLLWQTLDLPTDGALVNVITIIATSRHSLGKHVRHVSSETTWVNSDMDPGHQPISNGKFQQMVRYCPHLQSLRLGGARLTIHSYKLLAKHCPQLLKLELNALPCLGPTILSALADCRVLETVYFHVHIAGLEPWYITEETVMDLTQFPRLRHLKINSPPPKFIRHVLTANNNNTNLPAAIYPRLHSFVIPNCYQLDDNDVIPFLTSQPEIKTLGLMSGLFTDTILDAIAMHLPAVERLLLNYTTTFTSGGLVRLIIQCRFIEFIALTDSGFLMGDFPGLLDNPDKYSPTTFLPPATLHCQQLEKHDFDNIRAHHCSSR